MITTHENHECREGYDDALVHFEAMLSCAACDAKRKRDIPITAGCSPYWMGWRLRCLDVIHQWGHSCAVPFAVLLIILALSAAVAEGRVDKSIDGMRTASPVQWIPDDSLLPLTTPSYGDGGLRQCELDGT